MQISGFVRNLNAIKSCIYKILVQNKYSPLANDFVFSRISLLAVSIYGNLYVGEAFYYLRKRI